MTTSGLRLRHIIFQGPRCKPARLEFFAGFNLIYGASDTGKSFIVEAIDFMLGGKPPLRDIPEREGYDRVILGLETLGGETLTLVRSVDGGAFRLLNGLWEDSPDNEDEGTVLSEQHSAKSKENLSTFLLEKCGLDGKRVRKNKKGATNSLSFRNLARLLVVDETEITAQRSPLSDGNPTADTPNFATFKLLLTGVDDSALVQAQPETREEQTTEAQADLLEQLISDYRKNLKQQTRNPDELPDQLARLDGNLQTRAEALDATEQEYRELAKRRRKLRSQLEDANDRLAEIDGLLERFSLLDQHYDTDMKRLKGIEEAGTLFSVLGKESCPLCGAAPEYHKHGDQCEGDTDAVASAARAEIGKIRLLQKELTDTVESLKSERVNIVGKLPNIEKELDGIAHLMETTISPKLSKMRGEYSDIADKKSEVKEALATYRTLQDLESRLNDVMPSKEAKAGNDLADGDLPTSVAHSFAQTVAQVLKSWHFPEAENVYFDQKARDIVINGKQRIARGKGLRAITHAAFSIGLLDYCRANETPHPGFVILDSPLLAYREPEGDEDDLSGTDVKEKFYEALSQVDSDRQVIVVENTDPPAHFQSDKRVQMFSRNNQKGRYGFFPVKGSDTE